MGCGTAVEGVGWCVRVWKGSEGVDGERGCGRAVECLR